MSSFHFALFVLVVSALAALFNRRSALVSTISILAVAAACLSAAAPALQLLAGGAELSSELPWQVPGGSFALHIDALSAFFILPICVLSLVCAVYAAPYMKHDGEHRSLAPHWFYFNLMIAAMLLVVTAANAVLFLAAWELMTITSFFLVAWDHQLKDVRQAAWLYLLAAHLGMVLLLALFLLAGSFSGSFDFADFGALLQLAPGWAALLFLLALFGFGVKAGLFPIHIWLPDAHPAAPSHVSALMSGVLIKTGIYGILRVVSLLPPAPAWWGWLIALLGGSGALYGISFAAQQRDIKRCLAYSTVENIGIIFLGLGLGMVAQADGHANLALLAYAGGLLHLWNHSLFKGVMFLGAGALMHATGTRDMNRMGGLLKRMPLAGLLWIGGSLAIGALPPFNGLVSEWLIYLGLLGAGNAHQGFGALAPLLLFGLLGLVGALALVTFTRLIGIVLLGEPRDEAARQAKDAAPAMLLCMGCLLVGCLAIGLFPQGALQLLARPLAQISGQSLAATAVLGQAVAPIGRSGLLLIGITLIFALLLALIKRHRPQTKASTWGCGFRFPSPRMAYTGGGFSEFAAWHLLPRFMRPQLTDTAVTGPFPAQKRIIQQSTDPVLVKFLQPLFLWLADHFHNLRWLQQGKLPVYLFYMFIASSVLMAWSIWAGGHGGG